MSGIGWYGDLGNIQIMPVTGDTDLRSGSNEEVTFNKGTEGWKSSFSHENEYAVAVYSAPLGLLTEEWMPIEGTKWLGMIWLGVVIDAFAYLLWALALKGIENTAKIANIAYLTPFLSPIISAVILKEEINLRAIIALLFIVGGILLQSFCDGIKTKKSLSDK